MAFEVGQNDPLHSASSPSRCTACFRLCCEVLPALAARRMRFGQVGREDAVPLVANGWQVEDDVLKCVAQIRGPSPDCVS